MKNFFWIVIVVIIAIVVLGYFAFTPKTPEPTPTGTQTATTTNTGEQGKLNINVVCENALTYMSFPDGASAEKFVAECKEGKHPEVIDHYKAQLNLGAGATI